MKNIKGSGNWFKEKTLSMQKATKTGSIATWEFAKKNKFNALWIMGGILFATLLMTYIVEGFIQLFVTKVFNEQKNPVFPPGMKSGNYTLSGIGWYWTMFILGGAGSISSIIFLAGWLKGSPWLNKTNPYIKGETYIRTNRQNLVFRFVMIIAALFMLTSFFLNAVSDYLKAVRDEKLIHDKNNIGNWGSFQNASAIGFFRYAFTTSIWFYQCFIISLILGISLLFRKYSVMPVVMPMALIGALSTLTQFQDDWAEDMSWTDIYFIRFWVYHMLNFVIPIFYMVAQRQKYSLRTVKHVVIFSFAVSLAPYFMITIGQGTRILVKNMSYAQGSVLQNLPDWGELFGLGNALKLSEHFMKNNFNEYFWLMVVPVAATFTFFVVGLFNYFHFKSNAKGNWGQRWKNGFIDWKEATKEELLIWKNGEHLKFMSPYKNKKKKIKKVPFGIDPKRFNEREGK